MAGIDSIYSNLKSCWKFVNMELQCQYAFNGPSLVYNKTLQTCIRFLFPENAMYSLQISRLASQWLAFAASKMQTWLRKNISPIGNTPTANLISNQCPNLFLFGTFMENSSISFTCNAKSYIYSIWLVQIYVKIDLRGLFFLKIN